MDKVAKDDPLHFLEGVGAALIVDGGSNDAIGAVCAAPTLGASLALDAVGTVEVG